MTWSHVYDPLNSQVLSTLVASIPVVVLLGSLAFFHIRAHLAALLGLGASLAVAIGVFGMPSSMGLAAAGYGAAFGLMPIGWIIVNIIFLYKLTEEKGLFTVLRNSIAGLTNDRRLQLLLVAFCFGAFFEGAAGFGTPVAVTAAILMGLGFSPLASAGLSLIANTAPVAYGALGTPLIGLQSVTDMDLMQLSAMTGRLLPFFSFIVPFWLIWAFVGFKKMWEVAPAIFVAGLSFALTQFYVSNYIGPELVDVLASLVSMGALIGFTRIWKPKNPMLTVTGRHAAQPEASTGAAGTAPGGASHNYSRADLIKAWTPWAILSVLVFMWGLKPVKEALNAIWIAKWEVPGLHNLVFSMPPVQDVPKPEKAVFTFNILSATGTGIFLASLLAGLVMGYKPVELIVRFFRTIFLTRYSLLTIAAMMALGYVTKYAGVDATMGLAFAYTGWMYPFFGTLLGWLGVALTGSDTSSNVMFGNLQKITANQIGIDPVLMASANSAGGVMGKMIDAQSIVVASTATGWFGHEGEILRFVFWHSLVLAMLVGLEVFLFAYVPPFTSLVQGVYAL